MLDAVGDPITTVHRERAPAPPPSRGEPDPRSWWTRDSVLVVSLRNPTDLDDFNRTIDRLTAIADTVRTARRVVFDLRAADDEGAAIDWVMQESRILSLFTASPVRAPDQRGRLHSGFVPEDGRSSWAGYYSGFYTAGRSRTELGLDDTAAPRSAVILVNEGSYIPQGMLALREAGRARIVAEGSANDAGVVLTYGWRLPDSVEVSIRLTELLSGRRAGHLGRGYGGAVGCGAGRGGRGLRASATRQDPRERVASCSCARPARLDRGPGVPLDLPYRLLAAFKIWAVGQYFFPYRDLMNERWDQVLTRSLKQVEERPRFPRVRPRPRHHGDPPARFARATDFSGDPGPLWRGTRTGLHPDDRRATGHRPLHGRLRPGRGSAGGRHRRGGGRGRRPSADAAPRTGHLGIDAAGASALCGAAPDRRTGGHYRHASAARCRRRRAHSHHDAERSVRPHWTLGAHVPGAAR